MTSRFEAAARFRAISGALLAALAAALWGSAASAATLAELARRLPDGANAVVVVDARGVYASALGQREKIAQRYADRFEAAPLLLPPSAERGVLASNLDLQTLRPAWEAAVIELGADPSLGDIARRRGGHSDVLAGMQVTWVGKLCILKFAPRTYGAIANATRQGAARWAADAKAGSTGELHPYLARAVAEGDAGPYHIILAVDLAEAFTHAHLAAAAAKSDALVGVPADQAAAILASVQGIKFGVKFGDSLTGRLQLDFANEVGPLTPVGRAVLLQAVGNAGASLPEFASWQFHGGTHSLALEGPLTDDGLRRMMSLLALDAATLENPEADQAASITASADAQKQSQALASQRYFRGVGKYIDDINRLERAGSLGQAVMWIENYARKVESLPAKHVDPDLAQYGAYVAQTFRSIVDQASGLATQADAAYQPVVSDYRIGYLPTARTVNYGGDFQRMYAPYGYAQVDPQATQQRMAQSDGEIAKAIQQAEASLQQLVKDHETVRQKLTEKYGVKF